MRDMEGIYLIINGGIKNLEEFDEKVMLQGKTIYEVIRVMHGKPLFYNMHIKRLHNSAALAGIEIKTEDSEIKEQVKKLISTNRIIAGNFKIAFNNNNLYMFKIKHRYPTPEDYENGVAAVLFMGERKDPNIKLIDTDFRNRANEKILRENVYEAVLVDHNGFITEGSRSNIFMVKGGNLVTSPAAAVLPGITRTIIMDAAKNLNIPILEEKINYKDLGSVDGMFISGTSPKILPVSRVDNLNFKSAANPVILKLMDEYDKIAQQDINSFQL